MLIMFLGFLPQYCCISDFDDMINILRSYEVDLNMAAHQDGGKVRTVARLVEKSGSSQAKSPSTAMDALASCERSFLLNVAVMCYTGNQLLLLCAHS